MKIGYVANSVDLMHPADRRRFAHFARREDVHFEELNHYIEYDVVIVTIVADFSKILSYKTRFPKVILIFDYCDDLLSDSKIKQLIRPIYEGVKWKSFLNLRDYNALVIEMLTAANIIICGSREQQKGLLKYNASVVVIPDFVVTESLFSKNSFELVDPRRACVLWEGLSGGLSRIAVDLFKLLGSIDEEILLNVVTDPEIYLVGDRYIATDTKKYLQKLARRFGIEVRFWSWSKENLNSAIECSDFGIILIPTGDKTMQNKPENKLVLLSSFGLPVLVSSTPSYKRYLESAGGQELYALATNPNSRNLQKFCSQADVRSFTGECLRSYALKEYGEEEIIKKWKALLNGF
jgi:glycosyltransferase involved in cell wall biosynthesis